MNYQVEQWPAFRVMGVSHKIETSTAFKTVPKIWEDLRKEGTMQMFIDNFPDHRPAGFLFLGIAGSNTKGL